ncbi:MAG: RsmE family RNA methyltransferase, partial [Gammaproteobacteria bacterium]|nr:RsmE family RNA methyltransferase [Gammaproteobacteria bacterium]
VLDPSAERSLSDLDLATGELSLLIGSEAGLDAGEVALAEDSGYQRVSLGRRILRTETAAVAALGICQALWGDI